MAEPGGSQSLLSDGYHLLIFDSSWKLCASAWVLSVKYLFMYVYVSMCIYVRMCGQGGSFVARVTGICESLYMSAKNQTHLHD